MAKQIDISEISARNYTLIDGLTPDIVKRKYIWLLNAIVKGAIIGQDSYGLVWYSGEWIAGEWEDGTWYSGIWYDGEWKNGRFYSYRFDNRQLLQGYKRILEKDNPKYSEFRHGIWRRGEFYNGYFGSDHFQDNWSCIPDFGYSLTYIEILYYGVRWESGTFYNGIFRNAAWIGGIFQNGIFYNSEWINGNFLNGTFQGNRWWNGNFTGGDFVYGCWLNGKFNQADSNIRSRFGSMPLTGETNMTDTSVIWYNGEFLNGEFHSGLNLISGITSISDNHHRTVWKNGTWYNGTWYGGTHVDGEFNNGYWLEGIWSGGTFNNGYWYNGFWLDGIINDGHFGYGLFKNVNQKGGELGYQTPSNIIQLATISGLTSAPKTLGNVPSVYTDSGVTNIIQNSAVCGGWVKYDGGEKVTARGVCWTTKGGHPTDDGPHTVDGDGIGGFESHITGLLPGMEYIVRAYASNSVGTTYGETITFMTQWTLNPS